MKLRKFIAGAGGAAALVLLLAPDAQAQLFTGWSSWGTQSQVIQPVVEAEAALEEDNGNFTFQCPGCSTVGNADQPPYYMFFVTQAGSYDFYATGSAGDTFVLQFFSGPDVGTLTQVGGDVYFEGSNSISLAATLDLLTDTQYWVRAVDQGLVNGQTVDAECVEGSGGCRITLLDWVTAGSPPPTNPVPEPASMLLIGTGLMGLAGAARRRRKQA